MCDMPPIYCYSNIGMEGDLFLCSAVLLLSKVNVVHSSLDINLSKLQCRDRLNSSRGSGDISVMREKVFRSVFLPSV